MSTTDCPPVLATTLCHCQPSSKIHNPITKVPTLLQYLFTIPNPFQTQLTRWPLARIDCTTYQENVTWPAKYIFRVRNALQTNLSIHDFMLVMTVQNGENIKPQEERNLLFVKYLIMNVCCKCQTQ
ncbi:uncharacterized protein LOC119656945 [Hermetia illucens]|uniref:uncharacterized protein LOC119656945 n=1 Tax=Hermetia illucens TaxID=343691 RepID=UPI0018CC2F39|nr:uncharacterized protein LOC119656945 [Hermetia illucens]